MSYSSKYIDKYIKVIDCRNNNIIASGKVIGSKNDYPNGGISFDNKWFFRETKLLKYEIVDFCETKLLTVEPDKLEKYSISMNDVTGSSSHLQGQKASGVNMDIEDWSGTYIAGSICY